ncbi:hypothetical protein [Tritonibacter scottomollicae]|uniref:Immunity protein 49 of polymorphic toxin system n=1 Tax=Tritonibacter scottomollicae TaxID=483013 RepID=A0A2T1A0F7_TRISK|nr:hypothetical protein [Tritonibacter scottomollicae]PRZ42091.1 hypothetical protein CLV89_1384 [Tritonibacter scottomollicae]
MTVTVESILRHIEDKFAGWVEDQDLIKELDFQNLQSFLDDEPKANLSVGDDISRTAYMYLKRFILENRGVSPDMAQIALATRLFLPELRYAIGLQHLNTNSGVSFRGAVTSVMMAATLGWREQTELQARLVLQEMGKHAIQRGKFRGGGVGQVTTSHSFPYAMMDIFKDFLSAENTSTMTVWRDDVYQDYVGGHKGWADLADGGWRAPDLNHFLDIFDAATEYHVSQSKDMEFHGSKYDDDGLQETHYEVEEDAFWFYPVILFTILRLREWEGLANPAHLSHDLFQKGVFSRLPTAPDWPQDPFFDAVETKFLSEFPATPTLAQLPKLRAEQS